jgi:hypothetical protein
MWVRSRVGAAEHGGGYHASADARGSARRRGLGRVRPWTAAAGAVATAAAAVSRLVGVMASAAAETGAGQCSRRWSVRAGGRCVQSGRVVVEVGWDLCRQQHL